ncbi:MAG: hypothetical protein WC713_06750 [Candidatus Methylomirabilota bacterium]|jgi:hypothetical protein
MKAEITNALNDIPRAMRMDTKFWIARTLQAEIERLEFENEELKEQLANDIANYTLQVNNLKVRADKLEKQLVKKDAVLLSIAHYLPCVCDGGLLEDDCLKQRIADAEKAVKEREK